MVCNAGMDDAERIKSLGGATQVARLLSSRSPTPVSVQRVHNWSKRGIPASVKLAHPDLFLSDVRRQAMAA